MSSVCNGGLTVEVKSTGDLGKAKALMEKYSDGGFQEEDSCRIIIYDVPQNYDQEQMKRNMYPKNKT